jgi:DNA polymerase-4
MLCDSTLVPPNPTIGREILVKIAHILAPYFPCQVERLHDPSLAGKPLIIGGQPWEKGGVYCCSPEALRDGVVLGMPLRQAEQLCPQAVFLPINEERYQEGHLQLLKALAPFSPIVETVELGQVCLEASGLKRLYGPDEKLANTIRDVIERETNLLSQVGIASNRFVADVAAYLATYSKPQVIPKGEEQAFLAPLPIHFLPASEQTKRFLVILGIQIMGQVTQMAKDALAKQFGAEGVFIHDLALGYDNRPLSPTPEEPALRGQILFEDPLFDLTILKANIERAVSDLAVLMRRDGRKAQGIVLEITFEDGHTLQMGTHLKEATSDPARISQRLGCLLASLDFKAGVTEAVVYLFPLRLFHDGNRQLGLFGYLQKAKMERVKQVVRRINEMMGGGTMKTASQIGPPSPIPVEVSPTAVGKPWFVKRNGRWVLVDAITEHWRVEDDWRNGGGSRDYYQVTLIDGKIIVLCYQRPDKQWYLDLSAKPSPCPVTLNSTATATTPS